MTTVIHKRNPPLGPRCGAPMREGDTMSDYWDGVTCAGCNFLKPKHGDRTSFKHSHRAEGGDVDDVIG